MKHTIGPWSVRGPAGIDKDYAIVGDYSIIAEAWGRVGETKYPDAYANARLIAAAPELLEALERAIEAIEFAYMNAPEQPKEIAAGKSAIAKATGEKWKRNRRHKIKKLIQITEVDGEGLEALMGQTVTLFCQIYIYTGKLVGVNAEFVKLEKAKIVYETGAFTDSSWKDAQPLPNDWYIKTNAIESYGLLK